MLFDEHLFFLLGKNIGNKLTPDSYNVTTQRQAADYVFFWTMLDKDLEKPSSAVFTSESYTGTLFTGEPWAAGVTAAYGPSFTQSQSGSDTIFTVTDNVWDDALQANNPEFWKDKVHGGIIFNYEFTDANNHYLIQLLSKQLW